ncbi:SGNH/GDSL hydrolase family protein [Prosthecobacter sp.]|uniref:SGNH/GDSL hydrolase family protein n=1 Tax=Prosthecobacter sp. TaxID=1965333 RepID=UPI002AB81507|nr:SGNH/GDSL hydrolase family protein [Prosthecobacter sp.]MDZ4405262.1 SGNH/GDSL hydrolase family protein [Prosthecobacter sp.]
MNLKTLAGLLALACASIAPSQTPETPAAPPQPTTFEFKDGDRLVLIGNTVLEREQRYGSFEPRLALALGEVKVSVRNLAWSGDTVFGHARSYFGPPEEGLQRMAAHLEMLKPTVVVLCYGSELAFERLGGLPDFLSGYRSLIELIRTKSPGVRVIIATPPPLENLAPPLPDLTVENRNLSSLRDALRKFAGMQNAFFVDWFELMGGLPKPGAILKPLTENGVHYTREGYEKLSARLIEGLGLKMPDAPAPALENLRRAVIAKDTLFFNRWRPHNETYLFGFRKHEQGQNAKEIPMFDPLIAQGDEAIQKLKAEALAQTRRP